MYSQSEFYFLFRVDTLSFEKTERDICLSFTHSSIILQLRWYVIAGRKKKKGWETLVVRDI